MASTAFEIVPRQPLPPMTRILPMQRMSPASRQAGSRCPRTRLVRRAWAAAALGVALAAARAFAAEPATPAAAPATPAAAPTTPVAAAPATPAAEPATPAAAPATPAAAHVTPAAAPATPVAAHVTPAAPSAKPAPAAPRGKAGAAAQPSPAPAKPAPEPPKRPVPNAALAQLKPLGGSWTCTGRTFGPGPEHATSATLTFTWQLEGFWLEVRYDEQQTAANPVPFRSISEWGFDDVQQSLAAAMVDDLSGFVTATTAGWQGDKLALEGTAHRYARQFQARDTFVRHGDDQLAHTLEANVNDSWIKLHEDACSRVPAK
jgi:hypothetical protein